MLTVNCSLCIWLKKRRKREPMTMIHVRSGRLIDTDDARSFQKRFWLAISNWRSLVKPKSCYRTPAERVGALEFFIEEFSSYIILQFHYLTQNIVDIIQFKKEFHFNDLRLFKLRLLSHKNGKRLKKRHENTPRRFTGFNLKWR